MKRIIVIIFALLIITLVGCQTTTQETPPIESLPKETINQEFDIPSLIGKSPIEIEEILGEPTSKYEPTKDQQEIHNYREIAVTYENNLFDLQMDYLDSDVVKMYVCVSSGMRNFDDFLKAGNLDNDANGYSLKGIKALQNPSKYTCVEIVAK